MATRPRNQALKNHTLKKAVGLVLALLFCCCTLAGAQPVVANVQRYGPEQGLAHREVNAIFQDRRDFMWFGTKFGLNRFDGATFTTYTREKNGLDFDDIQSIAQDADGLLWLMGPEGKSAITLFDPVTGVATSFQQRFKQPRPNQPPASLKQVLLSNQAGTIAFVDHQPARLNTYHPRSGLKTVPLPQYTTLTLVAITPRNTVWVIADRETTGRTHTGWARAAYLPPYRRYPYLFRAAPCGYGIRLHDIDRPTATVFGPPV